MLEKTALQNSTSLDSTSATDSLPAATIYYSIPLHFRYHYSILPTPHSQLVYADDIEILVAFVYV